MTALDDYLTTTPFESREASWRDDCPASEYGCPDSCAECQYGPGDKYEPGSRAERVCGGCKWFFSTSGLCYAPVPISAVDDHSSSTAYTVADDCPCFQGA